MTKLPSRSDRPKFLHPLLVLIHIRSWHGLGALLEGALEVLVCGRQFQLLLCQVLDFLWFLSLYQPPHGHHGGISGCERGHLITVLTLEKTHLILDIINSLPQPKLGNLIWCPLMFLWRTTQHFVWRLWISVFVSEDKQVSHDSHMGILVTGHL